MILRNAAVRHGRRTLAAPLSRRTLRQFSTQTPERTTATTDVTAPAGEGASTLQSSPNESLGTMSTTSKRKQKVYATEGLLSLRVNSGATHKSPAWTEEHEIGGKTVTPQEQWEEFQRYQGETKTLGSQLKRKYSPRDLIRDPPAADQVSLELLMASQTHMGHNKSKWNPANQRYIYGVRDGTHIISLETTLAHLRRAARVVEEVAYRGGFILYVGTRKGQMEVVTTAAQRSGGYHVFTKWAPGSITNKDVMLESHATKVVDERGVRLQGFHDFNIAAKSLLPDLVVCLNPLENYTLLYECGLKTIPTIGIIDTDVDPTWVTYTIPANDDSLRSVGVIAGALSRAGQRGQARRKKEAAAGNVTWQTPESVKTFMASEIKSAIRKRKEIMGQMQNYEGLNEEETKLVSQSQASDEVPAPTEDAMLEILGQASSSGEEPAAKEENATQTQKTPASESVEQAPTPGSIEEELDAVRASKEKPQ